MVMYGPSGASVDCIHTHVMDGSLTGVMQIVGHSIGEITMGYASGHYDRKTAIGRTAAMPKAQGNSVGI